MSWQPSASIETLKERAAILSSIRAFFAKRGILEVETPLLSHSTVTDPHIESIPAIYHALGSKQNKTVYLQTSPEYAMKRLLACGAGSIYQITKAFRQGEMGLWHNPEFTMLEWYRPHFNHHDLMAEMAEFLHEVFHITQVAKRTVSEIYEEFTGLNPHHVTLPELLEYIASLKFNIDECLIPDVNTGLDFIFSHCIEPHFANEQPIFLYDFPVSQAALAKIYEGTPKTAARFELYFKGVELANGFHELQDASEQRLRFENDLKNRSAHQAEIPPIDERFLAALEHGLPDCSGVALGVDRLIMLALQKKEIASVLSFPFDRA